MKLGTYTFPTYFSLVEIQNAGRIPSSETPRRGGLIVGTPVSAEKIIRIEGNLNHATDIRTTWDALKTALMGGRQKFYSHDDRFIWATAQTLPEDYNPGLFKHLANIEIELLCDDPFWQAETQDIETWTSPVSEDDLTITNAGEAEAFPVITITAATSGALNIALYNGSTDFMTIIGNVNAGDVIEIDTETANCNLLANIATPILTDEMSMFDGLFWNLAVGANVITYEDNGSTATISSIVFTYRKRWH
jgi:phage-related protein